MKTLRSLHAVLLSLGLTAGPLAAQPAEPARPAGPPLVDAEQMARAEAMAREALARLLGAFDAFVQALPQYDPPEINERGDIIIRRRNPPPPQPPPR
jgi:hypothetical protein